MTRTTATLRSSQALTEAGLINEKSAVELGKIVGGSRRTEGPQGPSKGQTRDSIDDSWHLVVLLNVCFR